MNIRKATLLGSFILTFLFFGTTLTAQCGEGKHSTNEADAWVSCQKSQSPNPVRGSSHWMLYDLGYTYGLGEITLWNYNVAGETGKGFKEVIIDYSLDGVNWNQVPSFQLPEAPGNENYAGYTGPDLGGVSARYILITGLSTWDESGCAGLSEFKVEVDNQVLPVDLLKFSVAPGINFITLDWQSLDKVSFSHFEIERSIDAVEFIWRGRVNGAGKNEVATYDFKDRGVKNGQLYYYRLKMVDFDGTFEYSPVRSAIIDGEAEIAVFPNPAKSILNLTFGDLDVKEIIIQNSGQHEMFRLPISDARQQIDVSALPVGMYLLNIVLRNNKTVHKRFIKAE